ncbi:MAG TPA: inorganic phosphate transporter, partial [Rhizobiales bacterium]|nr:inorganic phosphate transporter [Hyphomicrobiales bacterium]
TTWVLCPILAAIIAVILYKALRIYLRYSKLHLVRTDAYLRLGLLLAGAFGAYALGANNIANVVGVFLPAIEFSTLELGGISFSPAQQLFLIGGLAIAFGVMTYSKGVMMTVGGGLGRISPVAAFVAVVSHSIVLFAFASRGLEAWLLSMGLPTIPLVPVSSSQAVVGAIVGIAILQGAAGIRWRLLGTIVMGWVATPIMAGFISFFGLYFLQNVFDQTVF